MRGKDFFTSYMRMVVLSAVLTMGITVIVGTGIVYLVLKIVTM